MFVRMILLVLGLLSGGLLVIACTLLGVFGSSKPTSQAAATPAPPPPTMIVVAARAIPTGTLIALQDLEFAPVKSGHPRGGDFVRPIAPNPQDQMLADRSVFAEIAGAVSRARFDEGDSLVRGEMVKPGDAGFLAAVLRPGMRAVTMSVNIVTGNAGLLAPGDRVDVVLVQTFAGLQNDLGHRSVAETIVTDLRVIAVDQRMRTGNDPSKDAHPAQTVTLEVTAVQAEEIDVGAKLGELALAIRGVQTEMVSGDDNAGRSALIPAVWAKDLSRAAAVMGRAGSPPPADKGRKHGDDDASGPQLHIYRGDKIESVPR